MQSLLILGRQPSLGLAELISLYGSDKTNLVNDQVAIVDIDPCNFHFDRLGGSLKFCKLLTTIDTTNWPEIEEFLISVAPDHSKNMPPGKMTLGLSLYGFNISPKLVIAAGSKLKKAIQATDRKLRFVPNKSLSLNTAQVIHNKLVSDRAWELVIVKSGSSTIIAQTVKVQDIKSYARRDQSRPLRDAKVGMLPPKLAQIIINLASGRLPTEVLTSVCDDLDLKQKPPTPINQTILDPFCGSGVILQEAALMGYSVHGSDLSSKMVEYSRGNLEWLKSHFKINPINLSNFVQADATTANLPDFNYIASETNLGKPLSKTPTNDELESLIQSANSTIEKFLINLNPQIKPGTRLCIAIPAWQITANKFKHLPVIDHLSDLGYNSVDFNQLNNQPLIYYRPNQIVARELLVIVRK